MYKKQQYRNLLNDLCSDYCSPDHYCILKEFFVHSTPSPRLLMQMKCVEKFKYERSQRAGRELTWAEAMQQWIDEGLANKFSTVYKDDVKFRDLYKTITS
jgi:hypothetical protein